MMRWQWGVGVLLLTVATAGQAGAVVVAKNSPIGILDIATVKSIFLGRRAVDEGQSWVVVYQRDDAPIRTVFETKVIGKTGAELSAYLAKQIFTGRIRPPVEVHDDLAVRSKLASTPNAIGYVTDAGVDDSVKIVCRF